MLSDRALLQGIVSTLFMLIRIPLGMAISLAIAALLLNRAGPRAGFYRTAFYMPAIVPMVAASLLSGSGMFNSAARA